ncbi:MAG TPA: YraN family protein [Candidatus Paceibacterota bacterium]|nr:YraN family protein [Candidatus Paceibacterota bacterium]
MKQFTSPSQKVGQLGENIACKYLQNKGFTILERNFTLKCGEIDIIANRGEEIRFFEVKTLNFKGNMSLFRPEDNIHQKKMQRLARACLVYADMKMLGDQIPWQIDVIAIEYDEVRKRAYVRHLECIY